jgi:hypothetical protein
LVENYYFTEREKSLKPRGREGGGLTKKKKLEKQLTVFFPSPKQKKVINLTFLWASS